MYRGAIRSMLSELVRQDRLVVTSSFAVDAPKTKLLLAQADAVAPGLPAPTAGPVRPRQRQHRLAGRHERARA